MDAGRCDGGAGTGVCGGLGSVADQGRDGQRDGKGNGEPICGGSAEGNKEVYYFDGQAVVDCSRSLFQQAGRGACWHVARKR